MKFALKVSVFAGLLSLLTLSAAAQTSLIAKAERITGDRFSLRVETPKGATVFAVKQPSKEMLAAIDRGLTDLFAVARKNRYRRFLDYEDYTVFIGRSDRQADSGGNYSPDIAVGAAQYAGTKYDNGGYIYAAGMVISNAGGAFVIAEHTKEYSRVSNVVRFEGEHIVLYHNDRRRYEKTKDHSRGGGHPILR